jgi:hypothetical protein
MDRIHDACEACQSTDGLTDTMSGYRLCDACLARVNRRTAWLNPGLMSLLGPTPEQSLVLAAIATRTDAVVAEIRAEHQTPHILHGDPGGRPPGENQERDDWIRSQKHAGLPPAEVTRELAEKATARGWRPIGKDRVKQIMREA